VQGLNGFAPYSCADPYAPWADEPLRLDPLLQERIGATETDQHTRRPVYLRCMQVPLYMQSATVNTRLYNSQVEKTPNLMKASNIVSPQSLRPVVSSRSSRPKTAVGCRTVNSACRSTHFLRPFPHTGQEPNGDDRPLLHVAVGDS